MKEAAKITSLIKKVLGFNKLYINITFVHVLYRISNKMSTFGGLMDIYRFISIDQFEKENLRSSAYFLSHCHQDHMRGLCSKELQERLDKSAGKNVPFYMSKLTRDLLIIDQRYNFLEPFIVALAIGECHASFTLFVL